VVCVDADVLWKREAHAVPGARKSWTGCGRVRGILRASERVHNTVDAIVSFTSIVQ
jgi:hypothetical protein